MWASFYISCLCIVAILYIPGFLVLHYSDLRLSVSIPFAPLISICIYAVVGTAFFLLRLSVSAVLLVLTSYVLSLLIGFIVERCGERNRVIDNKSDSLDKAQVIVKYYDKKTIRMILLYLLVGFTVGTVYFVLPLDGPESFAPLFDNAAHLSYVQSFSESGFFSPIFASTDFEASFNSGNISFYPAMLHVIAALNSQMVGVSSTLAMNAVLFCFISVVFPLSCFALISVLFKGSGHILLSGALISLSFEAFPWHFLIWGPLYSNLAAFSLVPAFIACFVDAFNRGISRFEVIESTILIMIGITAMAVTQPNADFTAATLLVPFCTYKIWCSSPYQRRIRMVLTVFFVVFVIAFWIFLFNIPALQPTVTYHWPATLSFFDAIIDSFTLQFAAYLPQYVLAAVMFCGALLIVVRRHENRWLCVSLVILIGIFVIDVSTDGLLKHVLSGFWYTDFHRIAASVALAGIPIAAYGLGSIVDFVASNSYRIFSINRHLSSMTVNLAIAVAIFFPILPALAPTVSTAFSDLYTRLSANSSSDTVFSIQKNELKFADEIADIVDGSRILNNPFDGSAFLYAYKGLNVVNRTIPVIDGLTDYGFDSEDSRLLRHHIQDYATNSEVRDAVEELDISYVLQLDCNGYDSPESSFDSSYTEDKDRLYDGISAINEGTPGFQLVAELDDMRLYRVSR